MESAEDGEKLDMDFANAFGRGHAMDPDSDDLIAHLATRIGMIMEDASAVAVTLGSMNGAHRAAAIAGLEHDAARISALIRALAVLAALPERGS